MEDFGVGNVKEMKWERDEIYGRVGDTSKPINSFAASGDRRRLHGRPREATPVDYCTERGWRPLSTFVFF